ncbi:acylphosphatase [Pseudoalteromonas luteoviolacea]|uniref:acylphosphatase n=1 Tax=Pseudoalteromonas luteoviolacea TaxID=43657 RepID=UPI001EED8385|nr:acylphosphatase [Pseudoalteromonas luteoviolacea]MCF6440839.1 acylphosphatase [Pseudoalteromonas luteoviolacea]
MYCVKFIVTGTVQGVGFRYHTKITAHALGLAGFAKNLPDRSVEVVVTGNPDKIAELELWLQKGPVMAKVSSVTREQVDYLLCDGFEIY